MAERPPEGEGLWVRSDVLPDGSYSVSVSCDADHAWTLTPAEAVAYAAQCVRRATEAEHDAAVLSLLASLGIATVSAVQLVLDDLRPARPASTGPVEVAFEPGVNMAGAPFVAIRLAGRRVGQLTPAELRGHAAGVLQAVAAVELDATLHRVLVERIHLDGDQARAVVGTLAQHWPPTSEGAGR